MTHRAKLDPRVVVVTMSRPSAVDRECFNALGYFGSSVTPLVWEVLDPLDLDFCTRMRRATANGHNAILIEHLPDRVIRCTSAMT